MSESVVFYFFTIVVASGLAYYAQKKSTVNANGEVIPNKFLWFSSGLVLVFVLGFREFYVGLDGWNYINDFNLANEVSFVDYYFKIKSTHTTEPGFYILSRIMGTLFKNYQSLFVATAIITVYGFYKSFSYEIERISLGLTVLIFGFTQYLYFFGIMRLGIAVSIVAIGYRYIIEDKKMKFLFTVLIATLFHYSAIYSLVMLLIIPSMNKMVNNRNTKKIIVTIPSLFIFVKFIIYPLISATRYQQYFSTPIIFDFSFITKIPFLLIFLFFYKELTNNDKHLQFYLSLFFLKMITEISFPIIGAGRFVWYSNLSLVFLLPAVFDIIDSKKFKIIFLFLIMIYSTSYSNRAYLNNIYFKESYIPYHNVFFKFKL